MESVRMIHAHTILFVVKLKNRSTVQIMKCPHCKREDAELYKGKQLKMEDSRIDVSDFYRCKCGRVFLERDGL